MDLVGWIRCSAATIHRVTNSYGQDIEETLYSPGPALTIKPEEVVYAELDGSMIFTDHKWREVKLGRVFRSEDIDDEGSERRGQSIAHEQYAISGRTRGILPAIPSCEG